MIAFGLLAGWVWTLLSVIVLSFSGTGLEGALPGRGRAVHLYLVGANLAAGIWVLWLYATMRARHGAGYRTAVLAGVAWWFIQTLQSSKWVAVGALPVADVWVPAMATLPAMILTVTLAAWGYERYQGIRRRNL